MKWYVCKMDDGPIYVEDTKAASIKKATTLKMDAIAKTVKAGRGCYELLTQDKQPCCIWIVREDYLQEHGWSKPTPAQLQGEYYERFN